MKFADQQVLTGRQASLASYIIGHLPEQSYAAQGAGVGRPQHDERAKDSNAPAAQIAEPRPSTTASTVSGRPPGRDAAWSAAVDLRLVDDRRYRRDRRLGGVRCGGGDGGPRDRRPGAHQQAQRRRPGRRCSAALRARRCRRPIGSAASSVCGARRSWPVPTATCQFRSWRVRTWECRTRRVVLERGDQASHTSQRMSSTGSPAITCDTQSTAGHRRPPSCRVVRNAPACADHQKR